MNLKQHLGACWSKLLTLLVLGWLLPLDAQALIGGNFECGVSGSNLTGTTFTAGTEMSIPFSGTCTAKRAFPNGAYPTLQFGATTGSNPARLYGLDPYTNTYMSQLPLGAYGPDCLGGVCGRIPVGGKVAYKYTIGGTAPSTPGRRTAQVTLGVTSIGYPNYAEWIHPFTVVYNVAAVSCSLSSSKTVDLNFGSISSANLSTHTQSTSVSINCLSAMRANVYLVPNQKVVSATTGVTRTSLTGLNMQALWTDTFNPVNFNTPRAMQLRAGPNNVNLSFKPQLAAGQSPVGAFQSQYTLNIDYL